VNLVGHVAVALCEHEADPPTPFLVGCMLPDLAAIARVRLARPDGELGRGVAFHHACDEAFHASEWFRERNHELRDTLFDAGVEPGAARACSHAGVEMLLDGALVAQTRVAESAARTLDAVDRDAAQLASLAPSESREVLRERLQLIGRSLDPRRYAEPRFVAERLQRMTSGRRRIELRAAHVGVVTEALAAMRPSIAADAGDVVRHVAGEVTRSAGPSRRRPA
jgi:hypothetical protein